MASVTAAHAQEIRFTDLAGQEVVLDGPAERIVTIINPAAGMAMAVQGSPERLVGINPSTRSQFERGIIGRIFPEVLDIPSDIVTSGFVPNVEAIAALEPDVVVQWGDRGDDLVAPLENAGITVVRYQTGGGEDGAIATLRMFGEMIGDTTRADQLIALRSQVGAHLAETVAAVPLDQRPSVLQISPSGDQLRVSAGGPEDVYHIYVAGGVNTAESVSGLATASPEQIAAWDPDAIFLFGGPGVSPSFIHDHPILSTTKAALDSRVYVLPLGSHAWGATGPEDHLVWTFMAELLFPDLFQNSLRDLVRDTYRIMFDLDLSDAQLDEILLTEVNGASANYDRFLAE